MTRSKTSGNDYSVAKTAFVCFMGMAASILISCASSLLLGALLMLVTVGVLVLPRDLALMERTH